MATSDQTQDRTGVKTYTGGCHCGAVRFQVQLDLSQGAGRCNCSICTRTAALASIVKPADLVLLSGESDLGTYEWGAKISRRYFCKHCGIHTFGRGFLEEIGGEYASVNVHCLDDVDPAQVKTFYWDGRHNNWEGGPRDTPWPIA